MQAVPEVQHFVQATAVSSYRLGEVAGDSQVCNVPALGHAHKLCSQIKHISHVIWLCCEVC